MSFRQRVTDAGDVCDRMCETDWPCACTCWAAMRVLFVEDQRVFAETVASRFLAEHQVDIAESVAAARAAFLADPRYDVALIDYDLPDGKGTELVLYLRAARFRGRIVAVSAKDDGNRELRAAGAHEICRKSELHGIAAVLQRLSPR